MVHCNFSQNLEVGAKVGESQPKANYKLVKSFRNYYETFTNWTTANDKH